MDFIQQVIIAVKLKAYILLSLFISVHHIYSEKPHIENTPSLKCRDLYYRCFNNYVINGKINGENGEKEILKLFNIAFEVSLQSESPDSLFRENFWAFFNSYVKDYPYSKNKAQIQLSTSALYFDLGNIPRAKQVLKNLLITFDGSTRFGSQALFYLSQIYYSEKNYKLALEHFKKISNIRFLPMDKNEFYRRLAEMVFRLIEEKQNKGKLPEARKKLMEILKMDLHADVRDSLQFHLAEINYSMGNVMESCRSLESLFLKPSESSLRGNSLYNFFQQGCGPSLKRKEEYQKKLKKIFNLSSRELDTSKKYLMAYGLADLILDSIYSPGQILAREKSKDWNPKLYGEVLLYLFRNAANFTLQKKLSGLKLPQDSVFRTDNGKLNSLQSLYKCYYNIPDMLSCRLPDSSGLDIWEKSIWSYIQGIQFSKAITVDNLDYLDSARLAFAYIGELNSELSFEAAQKLYNMYLWIAEDLEIPQTGHYSGIGKVLIKLQYQRKAKNILDKIRQWEQKLVRVNLNEGSREIIESLPSGYLKLKKLDEIHWKEMSALFNKIPTNTYSLEKEMALKILSEKIQLLISETSGTYANLSYLKSLLQWYYLGMNRNSAGNVYDKEAEISHSILNYLIRLEQVDSESSWKSFLGFCFYPYLYSKALHDCYYFTTSSGSLKCYPLAESLPKPHKLDSLFTHWESTKDGRNKYKNRENSAKFYILCEQQKIRGLKNKLLSIQ